MSRAAVIVIGSNSTRCVAGDFSRAQEDVIRRRIETRLFLHMKDGVLADADIVETAAGIARLKAVSDAPVLGIYATSAVRDAKNAKRLALAVEAACGLPLTVLSGEEEAAASFYGAAGERTAGIIDIGGGSTEVATGRGRQIFEAVSLQLGASRLFAAHPVNSVREAARAIEAARDICAQLPETLARHSGIDLFYSVGGTGTACACILQGLPRGEAQVENCRLTRDGVYEKLMEIAAVPREQRPGIPGFPASRVDIMPTGMAILIAAMDRLALPAVFVTERTNGDGLLRAAARKIAP